VNTPANNEAFSQAKAPRRLDPVRLSPTNAEISVLGLGWIVAVHHAWSTKGVMPYARWELRFDAGRFDRGVYSGELMQMLLALADAVMKIRSSGGRLYDMDPFQLAAMILGVRVAAQRVQHGHVETTVGNFDRRAKRLTAWLEKLRKRSKRAFIRLRGSNDYELQERQWLRFVRWLRVHFLDCDCMRRRRRHISRRRRIIIDQLCVLAKAELIDRGDTIPADPELRQLVRLALRYVQRGRTTYGVRDLLKDQVFGASRMANFITARLQKRKRVEQRD